MVMGQIQKSLIGVISLFLLLTACSSPQLEVGDFAVTVDPNAYLASLSDAIYEGREQQLDVLSPAWFSKAADSLNRAKKQLALGKPVNQVLTHVKFGKSCLEKAKDYALVAKAVVGNAIQARDAAKLVKAMKYKKRFSPGRRGFSKDYTFHRGRGYRPGKK